ncbi:WD40 repeat domain-containing protein [Actinoplanes oblitus]|uniref:WD40 repeat domain-containing protein n=1 Tax=Actinoplanes oblitus TaxID=3040509 RepID=A0ABY8W5Z1_9ACTN|nr:WD40 repeat domain-containing protein [Actinoplanes oblitus]WIM93246.1 WD40 repeat domain-containing protein [Actinoplanes oblitus]
MIDGDGIIEYGSAAFRAEHWLVRFVGTDDGRTLLAVDHGRVDVIDMATGAVTTGPRVKAVTTHADVVAVAPADRPDTVTLLTLPELTPRAEFDAGGPVYRLAMSGGTIAALTAEPYTLALIVDGTTHRIDLPDEATCLALSPDGTLAAVGTNKGRTGNVLLVDVPTGTVRHTLTGPRAPVTAVAVSAAHDVVVAAAGPRVLGWTPSAKKPKATSLWVSPKDGASLAGITPSGRLIAYSWKGSTAAVDPSTGTVDWEIDSYGPVLVHGERVVSVRFGDCRELDPSTGAVRHTWTHRGYMTRLSAVGDTVVGSGRDSRPMLLRPGTTEVPELGDGHSRSVVAVSFDGDRFATTGEDNRVCVWQRGRPAPLFTATIDVPTVARYHGVALDGGTLFAGDRERLLRFTVGDPEPAARSERLDGNVVAAASLTDRGEVLVACSKGYRNGVFYRLDALTLEVRAQAKAPYVLGTIAYTPGSATFDLRWATGFRTYEIKGFAETGGCEHGGYRSRLYVTPDHTLLVTLDSREETATLRVLDIAARTELHDAITIPAVTGDACMSAAGLLTTGHADAVRLWDVRSGTLAGVLPLRTPAGWGAAVRWTPGETAVLVSHSSGGLQEVPASVIG